MMAVLENMIAMPENHGGSAGKPRWLWRKDSALQWNGVLCCWEPANFSLRKRPPSQRIVDTVAFQQAASEFSSVMCCCQAMNSCGRIRCSYFTLSGVGFFLRYLWEAPGCHVWLCSESSVCASPGEWWVSYYPLSTMHWHRGIESAVKWAC